MTERCFVWFSLRVSRIAATKYLEAISRNDYHRGFAAGTFTGDDGGRWSSLHIATDWPGHFPSVAESIRMLVEAGANPNARCQGAHTETPLHYAASSNDVNAIDAGFSIHIVCDWLGNTPEIARKHRDSPETQR